ncbi:MAG: 4-(cytidine 5'-diphospho)-2-C-methyl-D-erythritol kinase, partial [Pseudomonadota bacterium]
MISELARAKVNLCLHVVGRRDDGYHLLDSLIVFPALGDRIEAEPARAGLGLAIDGPFGDMLDTGADNLVMRAAAKLRDALREPRGAALRLTKSLPVASGIGGGSADAAATLRALASLWERSPEPDALAALALSIGADVPACLASPNPVWMRGIGE